MALEIPILFLLHSSIVIRHSSFVNRHSSFLIGRSLFERRAFMNCSYHPTADSQDFCTTCSKPLCVDCAHQIKGKSYCQDCLISGAEWAATVKDMRIPADSPKRAALCSLIPGMGAVYNSQYLKALTFFAVFSALVMMGDDVHP